MKKYFSLLNSSDNKNLNYASHVMIGKNWLREQLSNFGILYLTNGGDTGNKRIDWNIGKSHCNDAVCITNLNPDTCDVHGAGKIAGLHRVVILVQNRRDTRRQRRSRHDFLRAHSVRIQRILAG